MAQGRMIKRNMSKSKKLAALSSDSARFLYLIMYPHADVEGKIEAEPLLVKGQIIPLLDWDVQKVEKCLDELDRVGLIRLYSIEDDRYLQISRFKDFQSLREDREAKSEIPDPPNGELPENSRSSPALSLSLSKDNKKQATPSPCDALCKQVYEKGFNIYALINKVNNQRNSIHPIPDEVIHSVCQEYLKDPSAVKKEWPWFVRVLSSKLDEYFANQQQQNKPDPRGGFSESVAEILQGVLA